MARSKLVSKLRLPYKCTYNGVDYVGLARVAQNKWNDENLKFEKSSLYVILSFRWLYMKKVRYTI